MSAPWTLYDLHIYEHTFKVAWDDGTHVDLVWDRDISSNDTLSRDHWMGETSK